jgi:hypothetical protein
VVIQKRIEVTAEPFGVTVPGNVAEVLSRVETTSVFAVGAVAAAELLATKLFTEP